MADYMAAIKNTMNWEKYVCPSAHIQEAKNVNKNACFGDREASFLLD